MQQVLIHQNLIKRLIWQLKSEVDKLDIDKLEKIQNGLKSLKSKVGKISDDSRIFRICVLVFGISKT